MAKNTVMGKHLDTLVAGFKKHKTVLVCVESEEPPVGFLSSLLTNLKLSESSEVTCYFGADNTSKIFALRLLSTSIKCTFPDAVSHFHSSFFPYF